MAPNQTLVGPTEKHQKGKIEVAQLPQPRKLCSVFSLIAASLTEFSRFRVDYLVLAADIKP